ncbi:MAG: hypothetical protein IT495_08880 [Gammaproteobacteria bacterium]|nr:hypothetical protein [Gammaproteobacteria bacterium]
MNIEYWHPASAGERTADALMRRRHGQPLRQSGAVCGEHAGAIDESGAVTADAFRTDRPGETRAATAGERVRIPTGAARRMQARRGERVVRYNAERSG